MTKCDLSLGCKYGSKYKKQCDIPDNTMDNKYHMITFSASDTKKAFNKIQYLFMIKTLNKIGK